MARTNRTDLGLLAIRVGVGGTLFAHGAQKLFGWFGGHGLEATSGAMEQMGFRPGRRSALLAGLGETAGGAGLALGLATPVSGAATAATMTAAGMVHAPGGFWNMSGGYELNAVLATTGAALAVAGPGRYSLDHALDHRLNRSWMVAAALAVVGAATAQVIAARQKAVAQAPTSDDEQLDAAAAAEQAQAA